MEKEPRLGGSKEADEKEPRQPAPDTSPQKEKPEVVPPPVKEKEQKPVSELSEVSVAFEALPNLVGKNIVFRDPHTLPNRTDDPYYKTGKLEQQNSKFVIVVDRGRYYPYYTGDRQNIFALDSQEDIIRLDVKLEK